MAATGATLVGHAAQSRVFVNQEIVSCIRMQIKPKRRDVVGGCDLCPLEPPHNLLFEPRLSSERPLYPPLPTMILTSNDCNTLRFSMEFRPQYLSRHSLTGGCRPYLWAVPTPSTANKRPRSSHTRRQMDNNGFSLSLPRRLHLRLHPPWRPSTIQSRPKPPHDMVLRTYAPSTPPLLPQAMPP